MFGILVAGIFAAPLLAATADAVSSRINGLRDLGAAFKRVNDELKSATPQVGAIQLSAGQIRNAAQAQYDWFPAGSGPQPGIKTAAKVEIWEQSAEFKAAQDALASQAEAFMKIASTGDIEKIRPQAKLLGEACSKCHKQFRAKEKH